MEKISGFDSEKFIKIQGDKIKERITKFNNKLYLEFGGKIFDDFHASRVLPGYEPNVKTKLLQTLKDDMEIIFCISAVDIEKNKVRADFGITYDREVLRLIDELRNLGLNINSVVITLFNEQPQAIQFANKLKNRNEKVYFHYYTKGYPTDIESIVSDEGYGKNPYIETTKSLVVVSAPGPNSGKLATCLSQLYHEYKRGNNAGYAKFETFPVHNLPLKHPVNVAYEAATAEIKDVNMIDFYHLQKYGEVAVNYNRDMDTFPILKEILFRIMGKDIYYSPTDMGVNEIGNCITNDEICCKASKQEIIRRYYRAQADFKKGIGKKETTERVELLMNELKITPDDYEVAKVANQTYEKFNMRSVAIELDDGKIVTGKAKGIMSAVASALINSLKTLAKIDDSFLLFTPERLKPLKFYKTDILRQGNRELNINDVLLALSFYEKEDIVVRRCLKQLKNLENCKLHSSHILSNIEQATLRKLGIITTFSPLFEDNRLYTD